MGTTIKIKCIDQTLTYEGTPTVASGGVNEDYIQFEFGPLWDGFSKVAVFYRNKGEMYYGLVSTDNTVVVPKEVTATKGTMYLGVMGVNGDVTRTSQVLQYRIESGALDGFTPEEPTADIYQQILAELQTIRDLSAETLSNEETFEKAITEQQNSFETNLNGQMTTFRSEVDTEITEKLSKVYRPCGSVANFESLPTDAEIGDVYNLLDTGVNWAWTGTEWDSLAGIIDVSKFVAKSEIGDLIYPVGSIYMSVNDVNPSILFGGTWEQIKDRFLLSCGDTYTNGSTGGSSTHTHKYGMTYLSYYDSFEFLGTTDTSLHNYTDSTKYTLPNHQYIDQATHELNGGAATSTKTVTSDKRKVVANTSYTSTLPPYLAVCIWKRTA